MEHDLRNLLDKIYELEGIVALALRRPEDRREFLHILVNKSQEISESCRALSHDASSIASGQVSPATNREAGNDLEEYSLEEEPAEPKTRGKLVFSINDRYRFKKALFANSDAAFNNTLALLASMENFEEAEDYFLNEEEFDSHNPLVIEFFEIIKKYFK